MNAEEIEKLLQKGPDIRVPDGLLGRLKTNIRVPRVERSRPGFDARPSWLKRWMPALALTSILLLCMVAVAVQTNIILELKQQNEALRATTGNLEALRTANAEFQKLSAQNQDLERLRKDNVELQKLRVEVVQLTALAPEAEKLRAENQQLRTQMVSRWVEVGTSSAVETTAEAESVNCINNLKQLGISFRLWAGDNNDRFPADFISMTNELNTWKILKCPSDTSRSVTSWADVAAGNVSYRRVSSGPNAQEDQPDVVLVQCPIHGHILLTDGRVHRGTPELQNHLKLTNGVTIFIP
jgi:hypothetical protein